MADLSGRFHELDAELDETWRRLDDEQRANEGYIGQEDIYNQLYKAHLFLKSEKESLVNVNEIIVKERTVAVEELKAKVAAGATVTFLLL